MSATTSSSCQLTCTRSPRPSSPARDAVVALEDGDPDAGIEIHHAADGAADVDRLHDGPRRGAHALPRAGLVRKGQLLGPDRVLALPADELRRPVDVEQVGCADEIGDETGCRLLVELARGAELLDAARVEHGDAVGERERLFLIVRHEDEGDAEIALDLLQLDLHLLAELEVQGTERLVQEQHLGLDDRGARECDALSLTAGELRGLAVGEVLQAHRGERLRRTLAPLLAAAYPARGGHRRRCRGRSCGGRARSPGTPC